MGAIVLSSCTGSGPTWDELAPDDIDRDPAVALKFFTEAESLDPDSQAGSRTEYVLLERDWEPEEWEAIATALDSATTDQDLIDDPNAAADAAQLVSEAVHYLSKRKDLDEIRDAIADGEAKAMAPSLCQTLTRYLLGVDTHNNPLLSDGAEPDVLRPYVDGIGYVENVPHLDEYSLKTVARLAVATDEGIAACQEGMGEFRVSYLTPLVKNTAATPDDESARDVLQEGLGTDARLSGMFMSLAEDDTVRDQFYQASLESVSDILGRSGLVATEYLDDAGYEEEYQEELALDLNGLPAT